MAACHLCRRSCPYHASPQEHDDAEGLLRGEQVVSGSLSPELGSWLSALRTPCVTLGWALDSWTIAPHP